MTPSLQLNETRGICDLRMRGRTYADHAFLEAPEAHILLQCRMMFSDVYFGGLCGISKFVLPRCSRRFKAIVLFGGCVAQLADCPLQSLSKSDSGYGVLPCDDAGGRWQGGGAVVLAGE